MRYSFFILFIGFILISCKKDDPLGSLTQPILSVNETLDSLQYTLTIPKATFGVRDTLIATLTELNLRSIPETLYVNTANMHWTLKNDSGRVVLYGPHIEEYHFTMEIIAPHQSTVIGEIWYPMPIMPVGSYLLSIDGYLDLSLRLSIE